jgi:glycerol-3-phosphate O-acyltransferase 3/4
MWALGVAFRYCVLFPLRVLVLLLGWVFFGSAMLIVQVVCFGPTKDKLLRWMITSMSSVFVITWAGVIRYHGHLPSGNGRTNVVFVTNHTSLIDVIVLQQVRCFSLVGQRHKGMVRFLQDKVLGCLQCIWFDRAQMKDRAIVQKKLTQHAKDPRRNPLLVFPEGTCVNNRYVLMFKKGAFELGVPVCPVAIRYEKVFVDPFWSSRDQSFAMHLVELMTSWCLIANVYFLEPTVRRDGESAEAFAQRVKLLIADKAGLKAVEWDGYLKHFLPSPRLLSQSKQVYADAFRRLLEEVRRRDAEEQDQAGGEEEEDDDFFFGTTSPSASVDGHSKQAKGSQHHLHHHDLALEQERGRQGSMSSQHSMNGGGLFRPKLGPVVLGVKTPAAGR